VPGAMVGPVTSISLKHILISLTSFLGTPNSNVSLYSHFFSSIANASGSYITSKPIDDLQQFYLHMDSTLLERYWIKSCMKFIAVISHDNYYSQFYHSVYELVQA
jgi:hypothetical protein